MKSSKIELKGLKQAREWLQRMDEGMTRHRVVAQTLLNCYFRNQSADIVFDYVLHAFDTQNPKDIECARQRIMNWKKKCGE